MKSERTPTVVYCDCAYSEIIPRAAKDAAQRAIAARGATAVAVPDLCALAAARDPRLREWAAAENLTVIACYPRAVRRLFAYAGAPLAAGATLLNMRDGQAAHIAARLPPPRADAAPPAPLAVPPGKDDWVPWFPVIDQDRCRNCKQCLNFCVFGVYDLSPEGLVRVAQPRNCKNNCPACARICPAAAIIFPKCPDAPINGAEPPAAPGAEAAPAPAAPGSLPADELDALLAKRRARAEAFRRARMGAAGEQP
ncbi:MAG: ferredoxin family protein [Lentisphaerae bacterium]|nr:ferredoxin family protein [Lentisphaerota bacterium]